MVNRMLFWKAYYEVNNSITITILIATEAVARKCSVKNMFSKIYRKTPVSESLF